MTRLVEQQARSLLRLLNVFEEAVLRHRQAQLQCLEMLQGGGWKVWYEEEMHQYVMRPNVIELPASEMELPLENGVLDGES